MNTIIAIAIILLGLEVLRFAFGSIVILFTGEINGKPTKPWLAVLNLANVAFVVYAFVVLVRFFYGW